MLKWPFNIKREGQVCIRVKTMSVSCPQLWQEEWSYDTNNIFKKYLWLCVRQAYTIHSWRSVADRLDFDSWAANEHTLVSLSMFSPPLKHGGPSEVLFLPQRPPPPSLSLEITHTERAELWAVRSCSLESPAKAFGIILLVSFLFQQQSLGEPKMTQNSLYANT